jgi:fructose-1,6-bisphosphatase/inositol monophosphatase family enzyme
MPPDARHLLEPLLALHARVRASVVAACEQQMSEDLAAIADDGPGDTIYRIDRIGEETLLDGLRELARAEPLFIVGEGLSGGGCVLPDGANGDDCKWRLLIDPIDGTRGLMYQKRSGWILTGVAPNLSTNTRLRDIVLAVQTEIPLVKQHLSDQLWALRGQGAHARRFNRLSGVSERVFLKASRADTIAHGFASVTRIFPGARDVLAAIDDTVAMEVIGPTPPGKAACFEDQYASTAGQLYELMAGHDRFIADLRPLLAPILAARGLPRSLCCHPYDICTALIAQEHGIVLTDAIGAPIDAPFNVDADVTWIGYANETLRHLIEPVLMRTLRKMDLI